MPTPELSVDEIISVIKRSNLFNVVVEGRDDIVAYRALERQILRMGNQNISLISAGGRTKLLEIFGRIVNEPSLSKCVFICDKDTWVFSGVPSQYCRDEVITTDGYSIENDLLRDYPPTFFMDQSELQTYNKELLYFSQWFSIQLCNLRAGREGKIKTYVGLVLDSKREDLLAQIRKDPEARALFSTIAGDVHRVVRGKSLLQIAMRQLARKGRQNRHNHLNYLEHCANAGGANFSRISAAVVARGAFSK